MFCALSGEVPQEPVVSTKSGHVFEKRLIVQHVEVSTLIFFFFFLLLIFKNSGPFPI